MSQLCSEYRFTAACLYVWEGGKAEDWVLIVSGVPIILAQHLLWTCTRPFGIFDAGLTAIEVTMIKRTIIVKLTLQRING